MEAASSKAKFSSKLINRILSETETEQSLVTVTWDNCVENKAEGGNFVNQFNPSRVELYPLKNQAVIKKVLLCILMHLFQLCPPATLATFREVCKQWHDLSLSAWRSSCTLAFRYCCPTHGIVLASCGGRGRGQDYEGTPLLEFLAIWEKECGNKPFRKFYFEHLQFPFGQRKLSLQVDLLLETIGKSVTKLELEMCVFNGASEFRTVIFDTFPNLKSLTLNKCLFNGVVHQSPQLGAEMGDFGENLNLHFLYIDIDPANLAGHDKHDDANLRLPVSWFELFSRFPSISSLALFSSERGFSATEHVRVLETIQTIRRGPGGETKLPLDHFYFGDKLKIDVSNLAICRMLISLLSKLHIPYQMILFGPDLREPVLERFFMEEGKATPCSHQMDFGNILITKLTL